MPDGIAQLSGGKAKLWKKTGIQMHPRLPGSQLWKLDTEIDEIKTELT